MSALVITWQTLFSSSLNVQKMRIKPLCKNNFKRRHSWEHWCVLYNYGLGSLKSTSLYLIHPAGSCSYTNEKTMQGSPRFWQLAYIQNTVSLVGQRNPLVNYSWPFYKTFANFQAITYRSIHFVWNQFTNIWEIVIRALVFVIIVHSVFSQVWMMLSSTFIGISKEIVFRIWNTNSLVYPGQDPL